MTERREYWNQVFRPVHRLARAAGHAWGQPPDYVYSGLIWLLRGVTASDIEAAYAAYALDGPPDIRNSGPLGPDKFYFPAGLGDTTEPYALIRLSDRFAVEFRAGDPVAVYQQPDGGEVRLRDSDLDTAPSVTAILAWSESAALGEEFDRAATSGAVKINDDVLPWIGMIQRDGLATAIRAVEAGV